MSSEKLYELKKYLKYLDGLRGSGTQLISVYIPPGYPMGDIRNKLRTEISQASNIKSKQTRNNVIGALERIINHLKYYQQTPENGLVVFCGNISDDPSKTDIQLFSFEPPYPFSVSVYRCDSTFFLEPLKDMLGSTKSYGLLAMDGREATLAILKGTSFKVVSNLHNPTHSKVRKGGQSARRYERLIEEGTENYYKRIGEAMDKVFLGNVEGVVVGGPGPAKDNFLKMKPFNYQIKILGVVDTGYTDEYGIREIMNKLGPILKEQEAVKEKEIVNRFMREIVKDGLATYGYKDVKEAIETRKAGTVLLSEGLDYYYRIYDCQGTKKEVIEKKNEKQTNCFVEKEEELIEYLADLAKENNIEVFFISTDTDEGVQFLNGYGGIGALLRYK